MTARNTDYNFAACIYCTDVYIHVCRFNKPLHALYERLLRCFKRCQCGKWELNNDNNAEETVDSTTANAEGDGGNSGSASNDERMSLLASKS